MEPFLLNRETVFTCTLGASNFVITIDGKAAAEMDTPRMGNAPFSLLGQNFVFKGGAFLSPKTTIEKDGREILRVKRGFFSSKSTLLFEGGGTYTMTSASQPEMKLSILGASGKEALTAVLSGLKQPSYTISIRDLSANNTELLLLTLLLCYSAFHMLKASKTTEINIVVV